MNLNCFQSKCGRTLRNPLNIAFFVLACIALPQNAAAQGGTISLATPAPVNEGGTITFTVTTSAPAPAGGFSVRLLLVTPATNGATLPIFFAPRPDPYNPDIVGDNDRFPVDFAAGESTQTVEVMIATDELDEGTETLTATIDDVGIDFVLPQNWSFGTATVTATILDGEGTSPPVVVPPSTTVPPLTVSLSPLAPSLVEGDTLTFTVTSGTPAPSAFSVEVELTATGTNAADLPDFLSPPQNPDLSGNSTYFLLDFAIGDTTKTFTVTAADDMVDEPNETFTATLAVLATSALPTADWTLGNTVATVTIMDEAGEGPVDPMIPTTPGDASTLIQPRLEMASAALRRHAARFGNLTSTVVHNRLNGNAASGLTLEDGAMAVGGESGGNGAWLNVAYAKFNGEATGRQADIYAGVDFLDDNNNWLFGALIGYEPVDLDFNDVSYEANYTHFGFYGGMRVSETLMLDGAISYGTASPDVSSETVAASYDADRFTVRAGLTGDLGIEYGVNNGVVTIAPEMRILYTRESLDGFTDSVGGVASSKDIELGRLSLGPRVTWSFVNGSQVVGSIRAQWDFSDLDDGVDEEVSGAADVGVRVTLAPNVDLGLYGEIDGIGITNHYITYGGRIELNARF